MKQTKKRKPLLIDEMLALRKPDIPKDWAKPVLVMQERLREAKVFVFDDAAAVWAAEFLRDHPEAIALDQQFAIPPFGRMYIELPYPNFFRTINPGGSSLTEDEEDTDVGYFYDGPTVYVMSRRSPGNNGREYPMAMPLRYRLNRQFTYDEEVKFSELAAISRLGLDGFFWGSCAQTLLDRNDQGSLRALRENHSCETWYGEEALAAMPYVMRSSAGDLRNIIAMILFLNRTRELQYVDEVAPSPGFVRAKPRTLVRHSLVRLRLDPGPMFRTLYHGAANGGWRREHDVRGHFCHDKVLRAHPHEHDWHEVGVNQWKCVLCGGLKWWRKEHHRGRRENGRVKTSYEVRP